MPLNQTSLIRLTHPPSFLSPLLLPYATPSAYSLKSAS